MCRGFRYLFGSIPAVLLAVSTAAAADRASSVELNGWQTVNPPAPALSALEPASSAAPAPSELQLRPMKLANSAPYGLSNPTFLSAGQQTIGFQTSGSRASGGMSRHVHWAIAGAAIGAIIGAIDDDPLGKALIGGAVGFGLSYVVRR